MSAPFAPPASRLFALIPAAGVGIRLQAGRPKQYLPLLGKPMLLHAVDAFAALPEIALVAVVVSHDDTYVDEVLPSSAHAGGRVAVLRAGGATRRDSVRNGLQALRGQARDDDWILVHDAARPGLTAALVRRLAHAVADDAVGGLLALPVVDTLKRADAGGRALETVPRAGLWAAQTPQMFRYGLLCRALDAAADVTDEAGAVEALGLRPKLVEGSARNFKITLPQDVALAELALKGPA